MPYKVNPTPKPEKRFLNRLDGIAPDASVDAKADRTFVTIRHANGNDELAVEQIVTATEFLYEMRDVGPVRERQLPSRYLLYARRLFLVLQECNIEGEDGKPLFQKAMDWQAFLSAWASLPQNVRDEILSEMVAVNPHWGN